jgi:hypothetical protein
MPGAESSFLRQDGEKRKCADQVAAISIRRTGNFAVSGTVQVVFRPGSGAAFSRKRSTFDASHIGMKLDADKS